MGRNTWVKRCREKDGDLPSLDPSTASESESDSSGSEPATPAPLTRDINIGGKATVWMGEGDKIVIETPGGGAWGAPETKRVDDDDAFQKQGWEPRGSFVERAAKQAGF